MQTLKISTTSVGQFNLILCPGAVREKKIFGGNIPQIDDLKTESDERRRPGNRSAEGAELGGYGDWCPLLSRVGGLGKRREPPSEGRSETHFDIF